MPGCDRRSARTGTGERIRTTPGYATPPDQRAFTPLRDQINGRSKGDVTERVAESPVVGVRNDDADDMHEQTSPEGGGQRLSFDLDARQLLAWCS
jgi:hypothetical protein